MPKIDIETNVYEDLKDFCKENGLTMHSLATELISDGLAIKKWGDVPFYDYKNSVPKNPYTETEKPVETPTTFVHEETPTSPVIKNEDIEIDGEKKEEEKYEYKPKKRRLK